jgi:hypothetical protein
VSFKRKSESNSLEKNLMATASESGSEGASMTRVSRDVIIWMGRLGLLEIASPLTTRVLKDHICG